MNSEPQATPSVTPTQRPPKISRKALIIIIVGLSATVALLAGTVAWLVLNGTVLGSKSTVDSSKNTSTNSVTNDKDATATNTDTKAAPLSKVSSITATKAGTKFSFSYPDTWTLSTEDHVSLTRSFKPDSAKDEVNVNLFSTMPQSAGCSTLTSAYTVGYYDSAPIAGWSGNSYVSFYETDGKEWCFSAGVTATKDTSFTVGQSADKMYLQGSSSHPSIDTSASAGDQIYVVATRLFTSESQAKQYVASSAYTEQKAIIQSLTVVK